MKQIYYCTVASLRCDKTFNRVSQITTTYYECWSAALVIRHTKHMYHVLLSSAVWLHIFPHCLIKQHNFQKNVNKHNMFILIFPKTPIWNISYRKNAGRHHNKCTKVFTQSTCYSSINQIWIFFNNFYKNTSLLNFMKICPLEAE